MSFGRVWPDVEDAWLCIGASTRALGFRSELQSQTSLFYNASAVVAHASKCVPPTFCLPWNRRLVVGGGYAKSCKRGSPCAACLYGEWHGLPSQRMAAAHKLSDVALGPGTSELTPRVSGEGRLDSHASFVREGRVIRRGERRTNNGIAWRPEPSSCT